MGPFACWHSWVACQIGCHFPLKNMCYMDRGSVVVVVPCNQTTRVTNYYKQWCMDLTSLVVNMKNWLHKANRNVGLVINHKYSLVQEQDSWLIWTMACVLRWEVVTVASSGAGTPTVETLASQWLEMLMYIIQASSVSCVLLFSESSRGSSERIPCQRIPLIKI